MSLEDKSSRTELPTAKKIQEAYREGNFAKSPEIGVAFVMIGAFVTMVFTTKEKASELSLMAIGIFSHLGEFEINQKQAAAGISEGLQATMFLLSPMLMAVTFAAIMAGGLQTGFRLSPKALEARLSKLNPIQGFRRLFSINSLVQLGVDVLKFTAIGVVLYGLVREIMKDPIFAMPVPAAYLGEFIYETSMIIFIRLVIALSIIAILNYLYQKRKRLRDLMMTKQEVKEENKSAEVDPKVKNAQKQMARRLLQKQMLRSVPTADVVVTNPTHYAVALKYERDKDKAPLILAKGMNLFAKRIIQLGDKHGVPRVENRLAARMLFQIGIVGKTIPIELYHVVAKILGHVYRTNRYYFHKLKARRMSTWRNG